jgi:hypothetical protein
MSSKQPAKGGIPTPVEVRDALRKYTHAEIVDLSGRSGSPVPTLWRIRSGQTKNPGIGTVLQFWPFIRRVRSRAA